MSATMHAPEAMRTAGVPRRTLHWLEAAVVVLAAVVIGLVAWILVGAFTGPTHDTQTLFDKATAGWTNGDAAKLRSTYAPNAIVMLADGSTLYKGIDAIIGQANLVKQTGTVVKRVAPVTVEGNFASTFVSISGGGTAPTTDLTVMQIKGGKIVRMWDFLLGTTPPLTNVSP